MFSREVGGAPKNCHKALRSTNINNNDDALKPLGMFTAISTSIPFPFPKIPRRPISSWEPSWEHQWEEDKEPQWLAGARGVI
jgi:hypothetical protein